MSCDTVGYKDIHSHVSETCIPHWSPCLVAADKLIVGISSDGTDTAIQKGTNFRPIYFRHVLWKHVQVVTSLAIRTLI
jgi:hypothetical protein